MNVQVGDFVRIEDHPGSLGRVLEIQRLDTLDLVIVDIIVRPDSLVSEGVPNGPISFLPEGLEKADKLTVLTLGGIDNTQT